MLSFLALLGFGAVLVKHTRVPKLAAPHLVICAVTVMLFLGGLLGVLYSAARLIQVVGLASLVSVSASAIRSRSVGSIQTISIWFLLVVLTLVMVNQNYIFWHWDDFTHWGRSIWSVKTEQSFWNYQSPVLAKSYPPAQQSFQYLMLIDEPWSEPLAQRAQVFFILSSIAAIAGWCCRSAASSVACASLIFVVPVTLGFTFGSLLPDVLLAMQFAVAVSILFAEQSSIRLVHLVLSASVISVLKEIGPYFVLLAVVLQIMLALASENSSNPVRRHGIRKSILTVVGGLSLPIAWQWYLRKNQISTPLSEVDLSKYSISGQGGMSEPATEVKQVTYPIRQVAVEWLATFFDRFSVDYFPTVFEIFDGYAIPIPRISLGTLVAMMVVTHAGLALIGVKSDRRFLVQAYVLGGGFLGYLILLAVLYLTLFTESEARSLAGFERYVSTFLTAWMAIIVSTVFSLGSKHQFKRFHGLGNHTRVTRTLVSVVVLVCGYLVTDSRIVAQPSDVVDLRSDIRDAVLALKNVALPNDSVYFVHQKSFGLSYEMFRFEVLPHTAVSPSCWSIGIPDPATDLNACNIALERILIDGDYKYLVEMYPDKGKPLKFGTCFADPSRRIIESDTFRLINLSPKTDCTLRDTKLVSE